VTAFTLFTGSTPVFAKADGSSLSRNVGAGDALYVTTTVGGPAAGWATGHPGTQIGQYSGLVRTAVKTKARMICTIPGVVRVVDRPSRKTLRKGRWVSPDWLTSGRVVSKSLRPSTALEYLDDDHPAVRLFKNPNGPMTGQGFWHLFGIYKYLCGRVYVWVIRDEMTGLPAALYLLPNHWVTMRTGVDDEPIYVVRGSGRDSSRVELTARDVYVHSDPHPWHPGMADSPVDGAAVAVDVHGMIEQAQFAELRNRPFAGGSYTIDGPKDGTVINDTLSLKETLSLLQGTATGYQNAGKAPVLPPGVKYAPPPSVFEIGLLDSKTRYRGDVLSQMDLDEAMMGYSNESTYAGASVTDWRITNRLVRPDQRGIGEWLEETILREFSDADGEQYAAVFHNDEVHDPEQRRANVTTLGDDLSLNERRVALGFDRYEDDPDADVPKSVLARRFAEAAAQQAQQAQQQTNPSKADDPPEPPVKTPDRRRKRRPSGD
jgi:hypothetical protein